jgi:hypothetical protein
MCVNRLFYLGVLELHMFALWFCLVCGLLLSRMLLFGGKFVLWRWTMTVLYKVKWVHSKTESEVT